MFSNPFDSFHTTVVKAKEEREQLDRLLTVSTPRERLLVAGIALLLCILAAWLFLGSVAQTLAVDGVLVEPRDDPVADERSVQALVWVERGAAPRIKAGMPAAMALAGPGGVTVTVDGEVATIAPVPAAAGMAAFESAAPVSVHRVDIVLDEGVDAGLLAGRECRIVIELGRQSPAALLGTRRP